MIIDKRLVTQILIHIQQIFTFGNSYIVKECLKGHSFVYFYELVKCVLFRKSDQSYIVVPLLYWWLMICFSLNILLVFCTNQHLWSLVLPETYVSYVLVIFSRNYLLSPCLSSLVEASGNYSDDVFVMGINTQNL